MLHWVRKHMRFTGSSFGRATVGSNAALAIAALTVATASAAANDLSINGTTHCVGTAYTVTIPDAMIAQFNLPGVTSVTLKDTYMDGGVNPVDVATVPYVAGKDMSVQWTPATAGRNSLTTLAHSAAGDAWMGNLPVQVVQTAPSGASCSPNTGQGTGSASSIPVIGGLLSSLSAQ